MFYNCSPFTNVICTKIIYYLLEVMSLLALELNFTKIRTKFYLIIQTYNILINIFPHVYFNTKNGINMGGKS
jgi:hypothetical protein